MLILFIFEIFLQIHGSITQPYQFESKEHCLKTPFHGNRMTLLNWNMYGNTIITDNHIRLTNDQQSRSGGISNLNPIKFQNWEIHIKFRIHGKSTNLYGDGMAIWYLRDQLKSGPIFGGPDHFIGLAVIIDTYANQKGLHRNVRPIISVMINDGTLRYDHEHDGGPHVIMGCEANVRNVHQETSLMVQYKDDQLTLKIDVDGERQWKDCLHLPAVRLPIDGYLGLSASTGELSDNHDICSLMVYELQTNSDLNNSVERGTIVPTVLNRISSSDPIIKAMGLSSFSLFCIAFFTLLAIVYLGSMGYLYWQTTVENRKKKLF